MIQVFSEGSSGVWEHIADGTKTAEPSVTSEALNKARQKQGADLHLQRCSNISSVPSVPSISPSRPRRGGGLVRSPHLFQFRRRLVRPHADAAMTAQKKRTRNACTASRFVLLLPGPAARRDPCLLPCPLPVQTSSAELCFPRLDGDDGRT